MYQKIRHYISNILEFKNRDFASIVVNSGIVSLILFNVIVVVLETEKTIAVRYSALFQFVELFSVVLFSIEYLSVLPCSDCQPVFLLPAL
ncbi:MAG: hypothetical protein LHV68_01840 [Elusimicrobia bacterium]|nr:hypothetical protein [Candidatus Liberimonas magnetica]